MPISKHSPHCCRVFSILHRGSVRYTYRLGASAVEYLIFDCKHILFEFRLDPCINYISIDSGTLLQTFTHMAVELVNSDGSKVRCEDVESTPQKVTK